MKKNFYLQKSTLILFTIIFGFVSCNTNEEDMLDQNNAENTAEMSLTANSSSQMTAQQTVDIWLYTNNRVAISNEFFGVNNNWRTITDSDYATFENKLESINYQGIRFPGGWESEYYV
ncbi:hypothetical protein J8281_19220, partial [Aquimarina sp. U1-2]|nr:hypothetical protein [Aquimarina sp. U1-2]